MIFAYLFMNFWFSLCLAYTAAVIELTPVYSEHIVDAANALWIQSTNLASYDVNRTNHIFICLI